MKNLIGFLKRIPLISSVLFFLFFFPNQSKAISEITTYSFFNHHITQESIETEVVLEITTQEPRVISYFTASIPIKDITVKCTNEKTNKAIDCSIFNRGTTTDVLFDLNNAVVRPKSPIRVKIEYSSPITNENSYQISSFIPDTTTERVLISYPKEKGEPIWTSDPIQGIKSVGNNYQISIEKPSYNSISLLFGQNIIYKFEVNKVFSNSLSEQNQTFELILPPDTQTQTIVWKDINPLPNVAIQDDDGNYIFKYTLTPNESIDCLVSGYIFQRTPNEDAQGIKSFQTSKVGYWNLTDSSEYKRINTFLDKKGLKIPEGFSRVSDLDNSQKELLYKYLYEYTVQRLNLNKSIALGITEQTRVGANGILDNTSGSSPIDYADFFISILRGYEIPSRMVVGYISNISGYTSDGFFHYWVEFFDSTTNSWVTADPFFEDYFNKSFFNSNFSDHLTLLRRSKSPLAPNLTFYQPNDFLVTSTPQIDIAPKFDLLSELKFETNTITKPFTKGYISLSNTGNIAITTYQIKKSNIENIESYIDPVNSMSSQIVLPKQNASIQINLPTQEKNINLFVNIKFANQEIFTKEDILEYELSPQTPILLSLIVKIISILLFLLLSSLVYFGIVKLRKHG